MQAHSFPFNYLGLPLSNKKLTISDYMSLMKAIESRLSGWGAMKLSPAGRLVLLNSVLTSLFITCQCFFFYRQG
jgi:hypothetical protein